MLALEVHLLTLEEIRRAEARRRSMRQAPETADRESGPRPERAPCPGGDRGSSTPSEQKAQKGRIW